MFFPISLRSFAQCSLENLEEVLEQYQVSMCQIQRKVVFAVGLLSTCLCLNTHVCAQDCADEDDSFPGQTFLEPELLSEDFLGESPPRYLDPPEKSVLERFPTQVPTILQSGYEQCSPCVGCGGCCDSCTSSSTCDECMPQQGSCCEYGCVGQYSSAPCIACPHVTTAGDQFNINLFGTLNLDMLFNDARPVAPGIPFYLFPDSPAGLDQNTVSIHSRQTTLGALFAGPELGNFQVGGLFMALLFNDAVLNDQYGFLPVQAFGELKNTDWRISAGLQFDVFAPKTPTVLAFSALCSSGNAGNSFRGSIRIERYTYPTKNSQWTTQVALSDPVTSTIDPQFRFVEDNGWPNVELRLAFGYGPLEQLGLEAIRPFETGVSAVVGQLRNTDLGRAQRTTANVWGLAADYRWQFTEAWGIAGEFYTGEALGTYNGAILQNFNNVTGEGIRSTGGWIETFAFWRSDLHSHIGYGVDSPLSQDVADGVEEPFFGGTGRTYNSTIFANLYWDISASLRIGNEVTWRKTHYKNPLLLDNDGFGYHSQFQWSF